MAKPAIKDWIVVDKEGMARIVDRAGRERVVLEPVANAFDEDGVTEVHITLTDIPGRRGVALFNIIDNSPNGWADLTHSFTLFAPSYKADEQHIEKRGRFNSGDKRFLSVCKRAIISTTTGTVTFDENGRVHDTKQKRANGSEFQAELVFSAEQRKNALTLLHQIIIPDGITVTLNGSQLAHRKPVHEFEASLPTQFQKDGEWRDTTRKARVRLYTPEPGDVPTIFELGMPVVEERDSRWHIDVSQKVPVSEERNNVTPSYLRKVREAVLNNSHQFIEVEDANSVWVRDAIPNATRDALNSVLDKRFGEKRVVADPRDPEANKIAAAQGYTVINPKSFSKDEWSNIRQHDLVKPAGKVTPSNSTVQTSTFGSPSKPAVPFTDLSTGMKHIAAFAMHAAKVVLGRDITVTFYTLSGEPWLAAYGGGNLLFNIGRLGKAWFNSPDPRKVVDLLIHEFAHERSGDHLSHKFHDALCEIGSAFWENADKIDFAMSSGVMDDLLDILRDSVAAPPPEVTE